jgi:hypothetical protein
MSLEVEDEMLVAAFAVLAIIAVTFVLLALGAFGTPSTRVVITECERLVEHHGILMCR